MSEFSDRGNQHLYRAEDTLCFQSLSPDVIEGLTGTSRHIYEIWILSILGAVLIGLSGVFPLLVIPLESGPALKQGESAKKLRLMLSFAVGSLLGDVFLHLLPEVWTHIDEDKQASHLTVGLWVVSGLLVFMIIEKFMGDENEFEHLQDTCDRVSGKKEIEDILKSRESSHLTSGLFLKPCSIHKDSNRKHRKRNKNRTAQNDICESTAKLAVFETQNSIVSSVNSNMFSAFKQDSDTNIKVGLITTLAILLHEIPHEVGDFAILLRSGFDRWKAAKAQFFTALGGVVGAVTTLTAESAQIAGKRTAWILPFTSGGFMYIALVTVVPDLLQEKHGWESLKQVACVCFGIVSMVLVTVAFD